jgi:hypothetical protein
VLCAGFGYKATPESNSTCCVAKVVVLFLVMRSFLG